MYLSNLNPPSYLSKGHLDWPFWSRLGINRLSG